MAPMDGEKHGFYGHETPEITWLKTDKPNIFKRNVHTTIHCFDPDTLRMLFESKGFEVEEAYYMKEDGSKVTTPPSLSDLRERSEEHTSELQSLMRISYADFCLN